MTRTRSSDLATIGIAGTGMIGASWAALFASHGHPVRAWDPADDAEPKLRAFVSQVIADVHGALHPDQYGPVTFHADKADMAQGCELIFENAPEKEEIKIALLAELDSICANETIIASSTSSLLLSQISRKCASKERIIIAHPFSPPYVLPVVELYGTHPDIVQRANTLLRSCGKRPITLKKEMIGHIGNRLTSAMLREALYLLEQGVASAEDIDACISEGPGLRLAFFGPLMGCHLNGGDGGIEHYMKHLGPSQVARWNDLGEADMTESFVEQIIDEVSMATDGESVSRMTERRNRLLFELLTIKE